jgi:4'-phosphopantetheinyl transferase
MARAGDENFARRFFAEAETLELSRCDDPVQMKKRFLDLWTLKEAYLKATGRGLSDALSAIVFEIAGDTGVRFRPPEDIDPAEWQFGLFSPTSGHRLAIAVRGGRRPPVSIRLMART